MKSTLHAALAAGLATALSASALAAVQTEGQRDIARYEKAAGQDVAEMPFRSLIDWQALDDHSLAVWTASNKPWLVRVEAPCNAGLMATDDVGFTSQHGQVKAGTDYLKIGDQRCKVASIQPVDYRQVAQISHTRHAHQHAKMSSADKSGS